MADGVDHDRACVVIGTACLFGGASFFYFYGLPVLYGAAMGAGGYSGLILSPDLDTRSNPTNRWKDVGAGPINLGLIWAPYRAFISHRSWVSHLPIVSTAIRAVYLGAWIVAAGVVADLLLPDGAIVVRPEDVPIRFLLECFVLWLVGLSVSDAAHWLMDGCPVKFYGPRRRKRRKGLAARLFS